MIARTLDRALRARPRAALGILAALSALAVSPPPTDAQTFALRAGRVITASAEGPFSHEPGVIVVRDGRIEAVGAWDLSIPGDVPVVHLPDATVMPGLVSAVSGVVQPHEGDASVGAAFRAIDAFDTFADYRAVLAGGVTTAHIGPGSHRLLSGRGGVVRLGGSPEDRLLREEADLTVTLGERAFNAPAVERLLIPPMPERAIEASVRQRPQSRLSQMLTLRGSIERALAGEPITPVEGTTPPMDDLHARALAQAWRDELPIRVQADRAADLRSAISFLASSERGGYVVGGLEALPVASELAEAGIPLVYTIDAPFQAPRDRGINPRALESDIAHLAELGRVRLAIARRPGEATADLRLAAALALRAGLSEQRIIEAITRVPAEAMGVGDRVGSLEAGKDADLVILAGSPLDAASSVQRVLVRGRTVFNADDAPMTALAGERASDQPGERPWAMVVSAGTIWLGPGEELRDGQVLIEDGKIVAVGRRVARPSHASVLDAGPDGFVAPGLIDAFGHLGFEGDRGAPGTEVLLSSLVGTPDELDRRVASAGVTMTIRAPYQLNRQGSRLSAVKTHGRGPSDRIVRPVAALAFDVQGEDPTGIADRLKRRIEAGRAYTDRWSEYRERHEAWREARAQGLEVDTEPQTEAIATPEAAGPDPLTGTWEISVRAEVLPEPISGPVGINLDGTTFEGRILHPEAAALEHKIVGELDGDRVSGRLEIDTGGQGFPEFEGTVGDDTLTGTISFLGLEAEMEGSRTDAERLEFRVASGKRRTTGRDGEPLPPPIDEALEPIRAVLEKRAPVFVRASSPAEIASVLGLLADEYGFRVVLQDAEGASAHRERLAGKRVGVVLPRNNVRTERRMAYHQAADLRRAGVPVAFQSAAEDGARDLALSALYAVASGLSPDDALAAMTIEAARMYQLEDRVGSIEAGKDADLVVFSGHPFEVGSRVRRVIVNGRLVHADDEHPRPSRTETTR
ncbi:MAG: hypothetical protein EA378_07945 [Phycisphaerales bacterium]|nr:MAG: hypothetical protein EA378_07945 [Phycisphaerales bacterium]